MPTHYRNTGGHMGNSKPVGGGGGKRGGSGGAVGASNPGKAASLKKHMTGQPTVPHNKAHSVKKSTPKKSRGTSNQT